MASLSGVGTALSLGVVLRCTEPWGHRGSPLQLFSWAVGVSRTQLDQEVKKRETLVGVKDPCRSLKGHRFGEGNMHALSIKYMHSNYI